MNEQEGDYDVYGYIPSPDFMGRAEDDESDDKIGATFGDDDQDGGNLRRNVRHTPQQIQELENFYKECPHPSEEQKSELGRKLNLETKQIRCWFQNKRNQKRAYEERQEIILLRQENEKLGVEHEQLKQLLTLSSCIKCGGPSNFGVVNNNMVQQLKNENKRLKHERDWLKSLHRTPIQLSVSPYDAQSSPSLITSNSRRNIPPELDSLMNQRSTSLVASSAGQSSSSLMIHDPQIDARRELDSLLNYLLDSPSAMQPSSSSFTVCNSGRDDALQNLDPFLNDLLVSPSEAQPSSSAMISNHGNYAAPELVNSSVWQPSSSYSLMNSSPGRSALPELDSMMNEKFNVGPSAAQPRRDAPLLELATVAKNELIMLGQTNSPLWRRASDSRRETLNYGEYRSFFNNGLVKPPGYVMEASRETGLVLMDSLVLVKTLTTDKWVNVFAPIVSVASSHRLIPTSSGGPRSGSLRLIEAEFQVISPLVPRRQAKFLRYCEMLREGLWVVVDFTPCQENLNLSPDDGSNRLPSGVIIEDLANGYSKVTWIEQTEYEESQIPQLYQLLISSGTGLGAKRWLTTLQRHCQNLSTLSTINLAEVYQGLSSKVATEIVKLAQRMTINYYSGITGSQAGKWEKTYVENERQNMRLMTRKNVNVRGEQTGIVLSAATSVWFPVSKKTVFDFLSNQNFRGQWDIMATDGTSTEEKIKIQKSRTHGNYVSFLQRDDGISILQETWNDASGALLVYAPVEKDSMEEVMRGENSDSVQILPSGFSILPDGGGETWGDKNGGGCLLTLGYQFLVSPRLTTDIDQDFVKEVEELMDHTIRKIKSALSISS